jgi:hypothetical protein
MPIMSPKELQEHLARQPKRTREQMLEQARQLQEAQEQEDEEIRQMKARGERTKGYFEAP